ncbi:MAG: hypothetical protein ACFNWW_00850 [Negativicutes bacterium]
MADMIDFGSCRRVDPPCFFHGSYHNSAVMAAVKPKMTPGRLAAERG